MVIRYVSRTFAHHLHFPYFLRYWVIYLIYLWCRIWGGGREIAHLLAHPPNAHDNQEWLGEPKRGASSCIQVSPKVTETQLLQSSLAVSQDAHREKRASGVRWGHKPRHWVRGIRAPSEGLITWSFSSCASCFLFFFFLITLMKRAQTASLTLLIFT